MELKKLSEHIELTHEPGTDLGKRGHDKKGDTPCFFDTSHEHPFKIIKKLYNHLC